MSASFWINHAFLMKKTREELVEIIEQLRRDADAEWEKNKNIRAMAEQVVRHHDIGDELPKWMMDNLRVLCP